MNKVKKWLWLLLAVAMSACVKEANLPQPSSFDKDNREQLGDLIREAILADTENFPFLPNVAPYDTTVYWYLQRLYDQVTNEIRLDNRSPKNDRWDPDRTWKVRVLNIDSDKIAFSLPGGHFYISTGFLKAMEMEYELYYLLAFEASMVQERLVLNRLISEYNSQFLFDLAEGKTDNKDIAPADIALAFLEMEYEPETVEIADKAAANLICESSIYSRLGLIPLFKILRANDHWMWTRSSYPGRTLEELLQAFQLEDGINCGDLKTNGGYRHFVWEKLN